MCPTPSSGSIRVPPPVNSHQRPRGSDFRAAVRDPDGVVALARDLVRVPRRQPRRRVELVDVEHDVVRRLWGRLDRGGSRLQPAGDDPVVPVDDEEEPDQRRDRDHDHPGARGELRLDHEQGDDAGRECSEAVDDRALPPVALLVPQPVADHPGLGDRERGEDADHIQVDERDHVRVERPDQERRDPGQDDDAVRVDEPVAEVHELAREEAVAREHRGQSREALVRGVRGQHEDRERERLHGVVHGRGHRSRREGRPRDLRDDRDARARMRVHVHREVGDADEQRDRDRAHRKQRFGRVPTGRRTEGVDAVRDRFDAGQRSRAGGKGLEQHEHADGAGSRRDRVRRLRGRTLARRALPDSGANQQEHRRDERVRREREEGSRLADPSQVGEREHDDERERERDLVPAERGSGGGEREDAGGDGDGDGQDVVDEQGRGRDEARHRPEVLAGDDVGAAARLVRVDGLHVGEDDDRHHGRDRDRDGQDVMAGRRGRADQDDERRLGRVGDRRERVGGEDREGEPLREQRLVHLAARAGSADQSSLERKRAGAHDPTLGRAASVRSQDFGATNRYPTPVSVSR